MAPRDPAVTRRPMPAEGVTRRPMPAEGRSVSECVVRCVCGCFMRSEKGSMGHTIRGWWERSISCLTRSIQPRVLQAMRMLARGRRGTTTRPLTTAIPGLASGCRASSSKPAPSARPTRQSTTENAAGRNTTAPFCTHPEGHTQV